MDFKCYCTSIVDFDTDRVIFVCFRVVPSNDVLRLTIVFRTIVLLSHSDTIETLQNDLG